MRLGPAVPRVEPQAGLSELMREMSVKGLGASAGGSAGVSAGFGAGFGAGGSSKPITSKARRRSAASRPAAVTFDFQT